VTPNSPAAKAGLARGDVITAIDGVKTTESAQVRNLVAMAAKGTKLKVDVRRSAGARSIEVVLGEQPDEQAPTDRVPAQAGLFAGVAVSDLDATLRTRLRIPEELRGVVVTEIEPGSLATVMGLRVGDVIMEVNRTATTSVRAFREAVDASKQRVLLLVYRGGATLYMSFSREQ
jgi:serine protease Do